ncbi:MAG: ABC transporter ATP-binding protein [Spirochaetaceae bacterium]|nr:MAG: ABC transporter ATP-binding protein [Spirochaetaceae bacterium]
MELLRVDSISKNFGGVAAVADFSMSQGAAEISAIIGPNGAGKTTTFNLISGVQTVDKGSLRFGQSDITRLPSHRIQALGVSRTFQNIRLFDGLSVVDNVKISYTPQLGYSVLDELLSTPRVRRKERLIEERAMEQLAFLGLAEHAKKKPKSLSYGLRRRLELARALMPEPRLLLLDEPAAGLNAAEIRELMSTIEHIHREKNLSVIVVEHHMELVMNICTRIHVMDFGRKIAEGTPQEITRNEKVLQAYLGDMGDV